MHPRKIYTQGQRCIIKKQNKLEHLREILNAKTPIFVRMAFKIRGERFMKKINLALQGGGAHGAFTWGVLNRFLEDDAIEIEGISATSAGAVNAVIAAHGLARNGSKGAIEDLEELWRNISTMGDFFAPLKPPFSEKFLGNSDNLDPFGLLTLDPFAKPFSPYEFNPGNINPLRTVLSKTLNYERVNTCTCVKLFISATSVRTGQVRVFTNEEVTEDVILASASLPYLFQAAEIDGEYYWDGGYMGNPALFPLFYETQTRDIMIVHINPIIYNKVPRTSVEIQDRINEITFNSSLLKEFRAIAFVQKLIDDNMLKDEFRDKFKYMLIHSIRADKSLDGLHASSKFNTSWPFLVDLRNRGYEEASKWLDKHRYALGEKSTVNLRRDYLTEMNDSIR